MHIPRFFSMFKEDSFIEVDDFSSTLTFFFSHLHVHAVGRSVANFSMAATFSEASDDEVKLSNRMIARHSFGSC